MDLSLKMSKYSTIAIIIIGSLIFPGFKSVNGTSKKSNDALLFKIERNKDANVIHYEVNLDEKGNLNAGSPVRIYWIRHTEGGELKPLTLVQKKFSYGLNFDSISKKEAVFKFVAFKNREFRIFCKGGDEYCVFTISNNRKVIVKKIFVQIDGGSFWLPEISRVELHGEDHESGDKILEIITP
ncbi:MAG: DUF4833 domain-containing protein [Cyclobacteriaceae bacterium]|nr:DUF4833 domain-containing protein [Cyclobacteriaceae bacterium]